MRRNIFPQIVLVDESVDDSFDMSTAAFLDLPGPTYTEGPLNYKKAVFEGAMIFLSDIAAGATELTIRVTMDPAGDTAVLPEITADIVLGITTATNGSVVITGDQFASLWPWNNTNLFLVCKTNTGTCTVDTVIVSWRGEQ
jgi:hypothetical protein